MKNTLLIGGLITIVVIGVTLSIGKATNTKTVGMANSTQTANSVDTEKKGFSGEKGQTVTLENNQLNISTTDFETNKVKFFNTTLANGKTIYFLVLKDEDGNF